MLVVVRLFASVLLLVFATPRVSAQAPDVGDAGSTPAPTYMMLPVTENDAQLSRLRRLADAVGQELGRRGLAFLPYAESAAQFQHRHSREPRTVTRENIEALVQESQRASRAAAARHANETKQVVAEAQARGEGALESLNRDEAAARAYFGTCLALIRVLVGSNERDAAHKVARDCQAAVPDLAPNPHDHPPSVLQVFDEVQRAAAGEGLGTLYVESEPTDCRVLLNGRLVGTTPYTRQAPFGHTYGVQVECGDPLPGRVHPVTIKSAPTTVAVDVFFDRSVRTSRRALRLSYPRPDPPSARIHGAEVARLLGADDVVMLATDDTDALALHLLRRGTSARLADESDEELRRAVEALLTDPPPDPEPPPAVASSRVTPRADGPVRPAKPAFWLLPTGASLTGAAIALGVVGTLRFRDHVDHGEALKQAEIGGTWWGNAQDWRRSRPPPYALIATGSALAAAGGIMMSAHVPERHRRWVSPLLAAAGIGVLVAGVVDMRRGSICNVEDDKCVDGEQQIDRGTLIAIGSLPLFASSIAQLAWLRDRPLTVHATPRSVGATLRF